MSEVTHKRQVFEAQPAPPPVVTEYRVVAEAYPGCRAVNRTVRAPEKIKHMGSTGEAAFSARHGTVRHKR